MYQSDEPIGERIQFETPSSDNLDNLDENQMRETSATDLDINQFDQWLRDRLVSMKKVMGTCRSWELLVMAAAGASQLIRAYYSSQTRRGLFIRVFIFQFNVKRELLDFCVNVKEFWELSVTREKSQYFYVNAFCKVV